MRSPSRSGHTILTLTMCWALTLLACRDARRDRQENWALKVGIVPAASGEAPHEVWLVLTNVTQSAVHELVAMPGPRRW